MIILRSQWLKLSTLYAIHENEARREYLTKVVLLIVWVTITFFTLLIAIGWASGEFEPYSMVIMLVINLTVFLNLWLAHRGSWRLSSYFPPVITFFLAAYLNYSVGPLTTGLLFYPIAIFLTCMLQGIKAQFLTAGLSVFAYLVIGLYRYPSPFDYFMPSVIVVSAGCIGFALLLWLSTTQLDYALAQTRTKAAELEERTKELMIVNRALRKEIDSRTQAEERLIEKEEQLRTVMETSPEYIWLVDTEFRTLFCNRSGPTFSIEDLIGVPIYSLLPEEEQPEAKRHLKRALESKSHYRYEISTQGSDGSQIFFENITVPMISDGKKVGLTISSRDITERKRTEEEIRGYIDRIEALLEIEKAITSSLDLDKVLDIIMAELKKAIPYDSISLQILQDKSLEILACIGFDQPDEVVGLVFPLDPKFPNQKVVTAKEALAFEDVAQEYPHFINQSDKYKSGHIRSWLGVPLISKGTVTGMISLDRSEVVPFSEVEIQLATAIASQAALAIENARLFSAAQRRLARLTSLHDIDQAITSSLDLQVTLNILLGHILQQLEVDAAAVLLYRPELQSLKFAAGQGFRTRVLQFTNLRLGQGFAGRAALERRIVQLSDLNQIETGFLRAPEFHKEKFAAYIGVPLIAKGKITGVLEIYHRHPLDSDSEWMAYLNTLAGQAAIAIDDINLFNDLQRSNVELVQAYDATIKGWAQALEMRDMETEGHSRRVVDLTIKLARKMGIGDKELAHIRRGALLHDIGKMGVSDAILQKPGKLNEEEWQVMRQHPVYAYEWLSSIEYLRRALGIPYCHHEKWDGTGYPRGLKGEQIPQAARIFALVDVWDALRSDRPYRPAWSEDKALKYIQEQTGKHFDPQVVEIFLRTDDIQQIRKY